MLPATLATSITDDGYNHILSEARKGKSLKQVEPIELNQFLTSEDEINSFATEIKHRDTYYPKLILDKTIIDKLELELNKIKNGYFPKDTKKVFNQYVKIPIPKVKVLQDKCLYVGGFIPEQYEPGTNYHATNWPAMQGRCIALYFPGSQLLGFMEVARGDFTGNGTEDILLWRYLDVIGARGSFCNDVFLLTREKPGSMLIDITDSFNN